METEVIPADEEGIRRGAEILRNGGLVGVPTETVYGLAADALNASAVRKIFEAKGRPADNPLIVHVCDAEMIRRLVTEIPENAVKLMDAYWPGPMTLIMPRKACVPDVVTAGLDTVGIRMPSKKEARDLIRVSGCPFAAPSANTSGKPSPTTAKHVYDDMKGKIPLILDAGPCQVGLESTVIDVTGKVAAILRPGAITPEMVEKVLGAVSVDPHALKPLENDQAARSPGMKYKHYAPNAQITIFEGDSQAVCERICSEYDLAEAKGESPVILGYSDHQYGHRNVIALGAEHDPEIIASRLFAALREMDDDKITIAFSESVPTEGLGLAIMNRLGRAAGFHIVKV